MKLIEIDHQAGKKTTAKKTVASVLSKLFLKGAFWGSWVRECIPGMPAFLGGGMERMGFKVILRCIASSRPTSVYLRYCLFFLRPHTFRKK